jgi:hypothetical protein
MGCIVCTVKEFYLSDQLKENEIGRACGMCGRGEIYGFGGKTGGKGQLETFTSCL